METVIDQAMTTVIFWDIDGTLLTTARAGVLALEKAASEMLGSPVDLAELKMAGQIDRGIAATILQSSGLASEPTMIERLLQLYSNYLPAHLPQRQGSVLRGVREILDALHSRTDVLSLLLTGNIEATAWAKLTHYQLNAYFDGGAFADRAENRSAIARQALTLAQQRLGEVTSERLYLVGDTPDDIFCGQAIGARVIAVATGSYSLEALHQHQPWIALSYLPAPAEFLSLLSLSAS